MNPTLVGSPTFAITLRRAKLGHLVLRTKEREVCIFFFYFLLFMENTGVWWLVLALASGAMKNQ